MFLEYTFQSSYFWLISVVVCLLYYHIPRWNLYNKAYYLPGPLALPLVGNCYMLLRSGVSDVFPLLERILSQESSGVVRIWLGTELVLFILDPVVAIQVNKKTLYKAHEYTFIGKSFLSKGVLITNDLVHWKKSRKLFLLGLTTENLKLHVPTFHVQCSQLLDAFQACSARNEDVFTSSYFARFTFATIVRSTMGFDINTKTEEENEAFLHSMHTILECFQRRMLIPVYRFDFIYSIFGEKAREVEAMHIIQNYLRCVVVQARRNMAKRALDLRDTDIGDHNRGKPFIDYLLEQEPPLAEEEVLAQLTIMVLGGSDTLVTEYTMLLVLLAQNQQEQERVHDELVKVLGPDWQVCPSIEDLHKLPCLDGAVKEALRMFPAGPIMGRSVEEDFSVTTSDGEHYVFPRGATTAIVTSNIHYNPLYYENPKLFDPDRWLPKNVAKRHPSCFLSFSSGARNCLGGRYAMLQMKTVLACLLRRFKIETSESCRSFDDIRVVWSMTVKISENCRVRFRERTMMGESGSENAR